MDALGLITSRNYGPCSATNILTVLPPLGKRPHTPLHIFSTILFLKFYPPMFTTPPPSTPPLLPLSSPSPPFPHSLSPLSLAPPPLSPPYPLPPAGPGLTQEVHCIEWADPPSITYGTVLGVEQLDATLMPALEGVFRYYLPVGNEPSPGLTTTITEENRDVSTGIMAAGAAAAAAGNDGNGDIANLFPEPDGLILTVGVGSRGEVKYSTFEGQGKGYVLSAGRHALKVVFTPMNRVNGTAGGVGVVGSGGAGGGGVLVVSGSNNNGSNGPAGIGSSRSDATLVFYEKKVLLTVERARTMIHWPRPPEADVRYPLTARHLNAVLRVVPSHHTNNDNSGGTLGGGASTPTTRGLPLNPPVINYRALASTDALMEINKTHFTTPGVIMCRAFFDPMSVAGGGGGGGGGPTPSMDYQGWLSPLNYLPCQLDQPLTVIAREITLTWVEPSVTLEYGTPLTTLNCFRATVTPFCPGTLRYYVPNPFYEKDNGEMEYLLAYGEELYYGQASGLGLGPAQGPGLTRPLSQSAGSMVGSGVLLCANDIVGDERWLHVHHPVNAFLNTPCQRIKSTHPVNTPYPVTTLYQHFP